MFSKALLETRMRRAVAALQEFEIDAWIMLGRETHFSSEPALMYLLPGAVLPLTALLITRAGSSACLAGALDTEEIAAYGAVDEVLTYRGDFDTHLAALLRRALPARRIALDFSEVDPSADGLSYTQFKRLERILGSLGFAGEFVSACNLMKRVRAQKSPEEIAGIERSVLAALKIYQAARDFMRSGLSGLEIQRFFQAKVRELDADYSWPRLGNPYVSIGARSSYMCKRPPADVFAQPGDLINVDFGLRLDGFASDNQRSFYILGAGESAAPEEVQRAFEAVQAANRAAVAAIAPGVYTTVPLAQANAVFANRGYPPVASLGHELGTFAHEGGMRCGLEYANPELDLHLEEGMTFTLEPAILTAHGRLCQEENIAVSATGCRLLSIPQEEIWLAD